MPEESDAVMVATKVLAYAGKSHHAGGQGTADTDAAAAATGEGSNAGTRPGEPQQPPPQLLPRLQAMCLGASPKLAGTAVYALVACNTTTASTTTILQQLASQLASSLQPASLHTSPRCLAAVHALSSIGCLEPGVYGDYVTDLVTFVLEDVLAVSDLVFSAHAVRAAQAKLPALGPITAPILAKSGALKALARGCAPSVAAGQLPAATAAAAATLGDEVEALMDVDGDMGDVGVVTDADCACVRLAAARACLRCAPHTGFCKWGQPVPALLKLIICE